MKPVIRPTRLACLVGALCALAGPVVGAALQEEEPAQEESEAEDPAEEEADETEQVEEPDGAAPDEAEDEPAEPLEVQQEAAAESARRPLETRNPLTPLFEDPEEMEPGRGPPLELESIPIHGFFSTVYRGRWTSDDSDNDLRAWAYVDVGDREEHAFTGHFDALLYWDIDGNSNGDGRDTFFEITDTYDSDVDGRLYEAYVDANRIDGLSVARLGRQQILETPVLAWFDGLFVETEKVTDQKLVFGTYGGIPVHVFESSPSGDAIFGAYAGARPWKGGRVRLDYMRLQDETVFGDEDNDLLNLGYWQLLPKGFQVEGEYSRLDGDSRDLRARATYFHEESDLTLQFSYYELLETQGNLALEINPFFGSLLELFPYYQTRFLASKSFIEWIYVEAGFDIRRVDDSDDIGQFNRDFERYYGLATFQDAWQEGLAVTLSGDVYDSDDTETEAWGLDFTKTFDERWEGALGTFYSLFKYDFLSGEERDHVRTYYLKVEYDPTDALSFDATYEFEDDDFDDYQTLRLGMSWRF